VRIPLITVLATFAQAAPPLAALAARRPLDRARAYTLAWCGVLLAVDLVGMALAWNRVNNHWLSYIVTPVSAALVLWTLSHWQTGEVARLTFRIAIVPTVVAWGVLTWLVDDVSTFSLTAVPMVKLECLAAAAFTLVAGSLHERQALLRRDWLWVSAGLALYFAASAALEPLGALLLASRSDLVKNAYECRAGLDVVAFLLIARGMTCPPAR
jgi:hypothetical protein